MAAVCNELKPVQGKLSEIGIQLGIPHHKMKEIEKMTDPLAATVNHWLAGNTPFPVSWETLAAVLKSPHVGAPGVATNILTKYCQNHVG